MTQEGFPGDNVSPNQNTDSGPATKGPRGTRPRADATARQSLLGAGNFRDTSPCDDGVHAEEREAFS